MQPEMSASSWFRRGALAAAGAMLCACTSAPTYQRPEIGIPASFRESGRLPPAQAAEPVPEQWWRLFGDETLNALQAQLVIGNENLRITVAQYRAARAALDASRAALFPGVSLGSTASRGRTPTAPDAATSLSVSGAASWEVDLWGRISALVDGAQARVQASEADLASVRLSLQAALAQTYFSMRSAEAQAASLESAVGAYRRSLAMTEDRYRVGVVSASDVAQAQTQLKSAQAQLVESRRNRSLFEHALAVLVGKPPSALSLDVNARQPTPPAVPAQLPAQLLERRPDIRAAERRVAAATAQIDVAKAAFLPAVTLSANAGMRGSAVSDLISAPNRFWSLGPALAFAAFDGGARRAGVDSAQASADQAIAAYRQTVLVALQEVEDNLVLVATLQEEAQLLEESLVQARRALEISTNQYRAGTVSYLSVVTAQATALAVERNLIDSQNRRLAATNQLLKNLAGTWLASTDR